MDDRAFHILLAVPVFLVALAAYWLAFVTARRVRHLSREFNGRMDQLLLVTAAQAHAQGMLDERAAEAILESARAQARLASDPKES